MKFVPLLVLLPLPPYSLSLLVFLKCFEVMAPKSAFPSLEKRRRERIEEEEEEENLLLTSPSCGSSSSSPFSSTNFLLPPFLTKLDVGFGIYLFQKKKSVGGFFKSGRDEEKKEKFPPTPFSLPPSRRPISRAVEAGEAGLSLLPP